jgi:hypothetical protein
MEARRTGTETVTIPPGWASSGHGAAVGLLLRRAAPDIALGSITPA